MNQKGSNRYTSLLKKIDSLLVYGYCRINTTSFVLYLQKLIFQYFNDSDVNRLYKLYDIMKIYHNLCKDQDYVISKCLTIQNYCKNLKFVFLHPSSFKHLIVININVTNLKYDLYYERSTTSTTYLKDKQMDCLSQYPKDGQLLRVFILFYNEPAQQNKHILQISMMDHLFNQIATMTVAITGSNVQNTTLYLAWANLITKKGSPILPSYKNGMLLIESYPKDYKKEDCEISINLETETWEDYQMDYCFKSHDSKLN